MLKFTGKGFIIGIPGRDLTDEEVKRYGRERLINSGLYIDPVIVPKVSRWAYSEAAKETIPTDEIVPSYRTRKKKLEKISEEADNSAEVN